MTVETKRTIAAVICLLLSIAFALSPLFTPDFNGYNPDQFPISQNKPPVQPAGWAFAIWGVIFLWLVAGMGWGLVFARRDGQWHDMRWPLIVSLGVGTFWLAIAEQSPIWASVLIWIMLGAALAALFLAPAQDRVWAAGPVGLYAGWLSAASCVSLGLLTAGYGWLSPVASALVFVSLASVLGCIVQVSQSKTPTYGLAVVWALVAIAIANQNGEQTVAITAAGGAALVAVPTLLAMWRTLKA